MSLPPAADTASCPFHAAAGDRPTAPEACPVTAQAAAFDPFDPAYMQAPADYLRWAREQEPVFWSPRLGYWVVTRYDEVKAVFRDNLLYSPAVALERITPAGEEVGRILQGYGYAMNRTLVNEDEPQHMLRRRLLLSAFSPDRLLDYEPMVRSLARQCMDRFIDQGRADLVREMFYEVPLVIALKFLGVPDEDAAQLRQFAVAHTLNIWGRPSPEEQLQIAHQVGRFWVLAQQILDRMRAQPEGQGWMHETLRQQREFPDIVTESYVRSMMMAILAAAHETTSNASANAFLTLLQNRSAWEALCVNPGLIPNAVEECLRVAGSIIAWRRVATADARLGGVLIPKGSKLLIVQASANVDPSRFENPEQVDLYRENAVEHLTFGYGAHQCMGKNIGRMQMRVFLEEFARRLPHMRLVPGQRFVFLPNTSFRGPAELWVEWDPARNPERRAPGPSREAPPFYIGPPAKASIARAVVVQEKHLEAQDRYRLVLADPQGGRLPPWSAGAHVDLMAGGFRRKYSLCGPADDPCRFEVVVQRDMSGRGGSRYFCEQLNPGDVLQLSGPRNLFPLDEAGRRFLLIAAGIGITPLLAMADRLKALGKPYELHYAGRSRQEMALLGRVQRDHGEALWLHIKSEGGRLPLSSMWGDVEAATRVYACGPERLIAELESLAESWPEGVLHVEHFQAAAARPGSEQDRAFVVELRDSDLMLTVPARKTLLQVLHEAGLDVPSDCGEGLCGSCELGVIEGPVDHRDQVLSKAERAGNQRMMSCCSRAAAQRLVLAL